MTIFSHREALLVFCCFALCAGVAAQTADADPKVISSPPFVLSDEAKAAGLDGSMWVALSIDKTGSVKDARILAGPAWPCGTSPSGEKDRLRQAVRDVLLATKFTPRMKNGEPREADVTLTFKIGKEYEDEMKRRRAASDPAPRIIQGGVINGKALRLEKPAYPPLARSEGARGAVSVWVLIGENGKVERAGAIAGHPMLQDAARDAACGSEFSPTRLEGKPVKVSGVITYNFVP